MLICSSLLPVLESAMFAGSFVEVKKEATLYSSYLKLLRVIASH